MKRALRAALAIASGGVVVVLVDAASTKVRARRTQIMRVLLDVARPARISDRALVARVRSKLARAATDSEAIIVSVEHGCVDLRGPVPTRERPYIVRAVARVPGVDSVLDLMTEPLPDSPGEDEAPTLRSSRSRTIPWMRRPEWTPTVRVLAAGTGVGLAMAALRLGGFYAIPAAAVGLLLVVGGAAATSRTLKAPPF